jgi:YidC/Oxa1 family membrane protein insertase
MQRSSSRLIIFIVLYAVMLGVWYSTFRPGQQRPQPTVQTVVTLRAQADQLEEQASDTSLSRTDREHKYQDAINRYQEIVNLSSKSDAGIDAHVQMARLHEEMASLAEQNTGQLDQAEQIYKDLAKQFAGRTATLTFVRKNARMPTADNQASVTILREPESVKVGEWANAKVTAVQKERADRNKHDWRYRVIDALVALTGRIPGFSYWFALLLLTLAVKAVLYPLTKKQFQSMQDMARVAPLIKEAQEKLKGRPAEEIHRRTMAIYKENHVNFMAGCLPALAQMALLIPLYQMIRMYEYQFRNGFFAWIGSALSHAHPQWLARNLSEFDVPLSVLYVISFYLTSKITPMSMSADPQQQQQQKMMSIMMPLIFGYMMFMWRWPAAFIFYWLVLNIISTAQQYRIIKQYKPKEPVPSNGRASGDGGQPPSGGGNGRRPAAGASADGSRAARPAGKGANSPSRPGKGSASRKRAPGARR